MHVVGLATDLSVENNDNLPGIGATKKARIKDSSVLPKLKQRRNTKSVKFFICNIISVVHYFLTELTEYTL